MECKLSELIADKDNKIELLGPHEAFREGYFDSPKTTAYMHVKIAGYVKVEYQILASGLVDSIDVIDSEYYLIGPNKNSYPEGHFDGYLDRSIENSVKKWSYQPLTQRCNRVQKIEINYKK